MYFSGMSVRDISRQCKRMGIRINHSTIYRWIASYSKLGSEYVDKIVPSVFVTDGLPSYNKAFEQEYAPKNDFQKPSKHIRDIHFKHQLSNNNIQERLNGEFRDREKIFRGLKKDDSSAVAGIKLYHNYIRPHMSLDGDTPASRAGIEIKGDNKWLTIIQNASAHDS